MLEGRTVTETRASDRALITARLKITANETRRVTRSDMMVVVVEADVDPPVDVVGDTVVGGTGVGAAVVGGPVVGAAVGGGTVVGAAVVGAGTRSTATEASVTVIWRAV